MRRLPTDRSVAALAEAGTLTRRDVEAIGRAIADFHSRAERPTVSGENALATLERNLAENVVQTGHLVGGRAGGALSVERLDNLQAFCEAYLRVRGSELARRAEDGRYVDGHGDLHAGNVFLSDGVRIIDCIEFDERFRVLDAADDLAFLAMDLDRLGRHDLSNALVAEYLRVSQDDGAGDYGVERSLGYFRPYRAWVRGKETASQAASLTVSGRDHDTRQEASTLSRHYFDLAHSYAMEVVKARPRLIAVAGLIGSGKSTTSAELSRRWGITTVSSDLVRKELAGLAPDERGDPGYDDGIYSPEFTDRTYRAVMDRAKRRLDKGFSVLVDASFSRRRHRAMAAEVAGSTGSDAWLIECVSTPDETRNRLGEREARPGSTPSDGRWDTYLS